MSVKVHCSLLDRPTFSPNSVEIFTYKEYFESIVAVLERFPDSHRKLIMDEWTK